jgi:hypothetical protein
VFYIILANNTPDIYTCEQALYLMNWYIYNLFILIIHINSHKVIRSVNSDWFLSFHIIIINHVFEEFTDCYTSPKSPRGRTLDSPPVVVQNWAILYYL